MANFTDINSTSTSSGLTTWTSNNMTLRANFNSDVLFPNVDLVFKEDGRIILRGREIHNDLELVNALRQNFGLSPLSELTHLAGMRVADEVDRQIFDELNKDESTKEEVYFEV